MFKLIKKDAHSRARTGLLKTAHGVVETPAYVIVGTHAKVRCLTTQDLTYAGTQIIIANTYHLWNTLGKKLEQYEGLHKAMNWDKTIMTDSGGFQVFSLGFSREHGVGKVASIFPDEEKNKQRKSQENLVRITEDGAFFMENGEEKFLDAEKSIYIQEKLGADIILSFDECTSPLHDYAYTKQALERTHKWANDCIDAKSRNKQLLYGIVQGGAFKDLRERSGEYMNSLPFDGFAIGGSFGKSVEGNKRFSEVEWSIPYLSEDKPRHLLGIGRIEDIFECVELGIDTFDCVIPTREARHGAIWTMQGRIDMKKGSRKEETQILEEGCECASCGTWKTTRKELHELFKAKFESAGKLATIHNVYFFNNLMKKIRESINEGRFQEFKKETLARIQKK